jgi:uncharacterized RDD family membrane protein YckC
MARCPNCYTTVDPDDRLCTACGELLEGVELETDEDGDGPHGTSDRRSADARSDGEGYARQPTDEDTDVTVARLAALLLDSLLTTVVAGGLSLGTYVLVFGGEVSREFLQDILVLAVPSMALAMLGYYVFLEGFWDGQTLGKRAFGIKVVKSTGEPCDVTSSAVRNVLRIVDGFLLYLVGFVAMTTNDTRQRVGDRLADTVVVESQT